MENHTIPNTKATTVQSPSAEIITIGNELLYGLTRDTNTQWLVQRLSEKGFKIVRTTTVQDNRDHILQALREATQYADVIITTGGLGPTSDDLTKPCMAHFFNCEIALHEGALADVTHFFHRRNKKLTEANRQQAFLPVCCRKITNTLGTAPGMWFTRGKRVVVAMPGVPKEMQKMMQEEVIPRLQNKFVRTFMQHHTICTVGLGESFLADRINTWEQALPPHIKLAYLPGAGEVRLRLTGMGDSQEELKTTLKTWGQRLGALVGDYIYGYEEDSLEQVVGNQLRQQHLTLALAESCTGGGLSHRIVSVPGSSAYYLGGVIAYNNTIKIQQLQVPKDMLERHGAVSKPVVSAMARSVRTLFKSGIGVATSGIVGPGGATANKPVGTIWIALCNGDKTVTKQLKLAADRLTNIHLTSTAALNIIRKNLAGISIGE